MCGRNCVFYARINKITLTDLLDMHCSILLNMRCDETSSSFGLDQFPKKHNNFTSR